jgi:hypothetical protein
MHHHTTSLVLYEPLGFSSIILEMVRNVFEVYEELTRQMPTQVGTLMEAFIKLLILNVVEPILYFGPIQWLCAGLLVVYLLRRTTGGLLWRTTIVVVTPMAVWWTVPPSRASLVLTTFIGMSLLVKECLRDMMVSFHTITNPVTQRQEKSNNIVITRWWKRWAIYLMTGVWYEYYPVLPYNVHQQNKEWDRQLYSQFRRQSGDSGELQEESGPSRDTQILSLLHAISRKLEIVGSPTGDVRLEEEEIVMADLPVYSRLDPMDTYDATLTFLGEKNRGLFEADEAGTVVFNSKAAQSVLRVVRADGSGCATAFKIGSDKLCCVAHANGNGKVRLGQSMVDESGKPLQVVLSTGDGKKVRFPLIPYYHSKEHQRDMVLCSIPTQLQSTIPGLRARPSDVTDSEVAIIGYPTDSDTPQFSTSRVTDRLHTAGSLGGMSGSPILVQGRVVIGVHEGITNGGAAKRFHAFTDIDMDAMMKPAPKHPGEIEYQVSPVKAKRRDRRRDRAVLSWADDTSEMDYSKPVVFEDQIQFQTQSPTPPTSPSRKVDPELVKQVGIALQLIKPESGDLAIDKPRLAKGGKKKKQKKVMPCPTLLNFNRCPNFEQAACAFDHKLKGGHADFHLGPAETGPGGTIGSERSSA